MAHFAQIDENNIVVQVLVVEQEEIDTGLLGDPDTWIQTSYNARIRGRFAGIGFTYDAEKDIFLEPKPYPSWRLDENNDWVPPVGKEQPAPTETKIWKNWNEAEQKWEEN